MCVCVCVCVLFLFFYGKHKVCAKVYAKRTSYKNDSSPVLAEALTQLALGTLFARYCGRADHGDGPFSNVVLSA